MALNQSRKFHFDDNPRVLQHDTKNVVFFQSKNTGNERTFLSENI